MGVFVALEGIDLSGKTTTAKVLAERIGGVYYKTPSEEMAEARKIFNECGVGMAKYLFYLSTVAIASYEIEELLKTTNVVVDRYLISTMCYHYQEGVKIDTVNINKMGIIDPHLNVCLTVNRRSWEVRQKERQEESDKGWLYWYDLSRVLKSFTRGKKGVVINTSNKISEETADCIVSELQARKLI